MTTESLLLLSADHYWEQDAQGRLFALRASAARATVGGWVFDWRGHPLWALPGVDPRSDGALALREAMQAQKPFHSIELVFHHGLQPRWVSFSGEPRRDGEGRFIGFHGVSHDRTGDRRGVDELKRFRAALNMATDAIYVVDRETMRFVDFNERALRRSGYTADELLTLGPQHLGMDRLEDVEREYDEAIAQDPRSVITRRRVRNRDGQELFVELKRRALRWNGRWLVTTAMRDVSAEHVAVTAAQRLERLYGALLACNRAMLLGREPVELYRRICDVVVSQAGFLLAAVLLPGSDGVRAEIVAAAGTGVRILRKERIQFDASREGQGLVGTAFRSGVPSISNDFLADTRVERWRAAAELIGLRAGAAVPLLRDGRPRGVMVIYSATPGSFDEQLVDLLTQMTANLAFALSNLESLSASKAGARATDAGNPARAGGAGDDTGALAPPTDRG